MYCNTFLKAVVVLGAQYYFYLVAVSIVQYFKTVVFQPLYKSMYSKAQSLFGAKVIAQSYPIHYRAMFCSCSDSDKKAWANVIQSCIKIWLMYYVFDYIFCVYVVRTNQLFHFFCLPRQCPWNMPSPLRNHFPFDCSEALIFFPKAVQSVHGCLFFMPSSKDDNSVPVPKSNV